MAELQEESQVRQATPPAGQKAPAAPEHVPEHPADPPKEKGRFLLPLLTILLVLIGIGETVYWSLMGISSYRYSQARRLYQERQETAAAERQSLGIAGGSAYGPSLKVENGVVTWQDETRQPASGGGGTGPVQSESDEKWLSRLSVPKIHYVLAQPPGAEDEVPAQE